MKRGVIIAVEGTDGSGKKTQTELLVNKAKSEGYRTFTMSFPDYESKWGRKVKQYLKGEFGTIEEVNVYNASWLYALDREEKKDLFEQRLAEGFNIILDRYTESNLAHQGSKCQGEERKKLIAGLKDLENKILGIPASDHVIFLDLPVGYSKACIERRKVKRNDQTRDIHEDAVAHLREAYDTYKMLAEQSNWTTINCVKDEATKTRYSEQEMAEIIWQIVKPKLVR